MRRLVALLAALAALTPRAGAQPVPLLWQVADADSRLYLLGSVHMLTASDYPLAPAVEAAYADAEVVAFEVDLATMEAEAGRLLPLFALDPQGRSLAEVLPDTLYAALGTAMAASGMAPETFDGMRPWLVSLVLGELAMAGHPLQAAWGVDRHFHERALADGRETAALESVADQFRALSGVPEAAQVEALAHTLATMGETPAEATALVDVWRTGNADALAHLVKTTGAKAPGSLKGLLTARNRAWVAPLEALLARDGQDALVVVGAAHLVGPESVVALLRARGHAVTRVGGAAGGR